MTWQEETIGNCRLILGDSLEVMPTLDPVGHIITDPPYEDYMHKAKLSHRKHTRTDGGPGFTALGFDSIDAIRKPFTEAAALICEGWFLAFCTPEGVGRWADEINATKMKYKRACTWVKPDATPQLNGQGPAMGVENFVCAWGGKGYSKWNGGGRRGVFTHNTNDRQRDGRHPTEKPIPLMLELVDLFTQPDQVILDPFMGSGTTGIACVLRGRHFIGIENDPKWFDVACERITQAHKQDGIFIPIPKIKAKQDQISFEDK